MQFDLITIFPEFFTGPLDYGIVRRAREASLVDVRVHDLRAFTHDRHRTVDDRPFGGGEGMVLKPEPLFEAVESVAGADPSGRPSSAVVLLSASGQLFRQDTVRRFVQLKRIILLCGRYEGVDERVAEHLATD
jgi:tRNA (guanine37-N1)-methyltransferase